MGSGGARKRQNAKTKKSKGEKASGGSVDGSGDAQKEQTQESSHRNVGILSSPRFYFLIATILFTLICLTSRRPSLLDHIAHTLQPKTQKSDTPPDLTKLSTGTLESSNAQGDPTEKSSETHQNSKNPTQNTEKSSNPQPATETPKIEKPSNSEKPRENSNINPETPPKSTKTPQKQPPKAKPWEKHYKTLAASKIDANKLEKTILKARSVVGKSTDENDEEKCHFRRILGAALSEKAELQRSNQILKESIREMGKVSAGCPDEVVEKNADLLISRCEFIGMNQATIAHLKKVVAVHPNWTKYHNRIGISYLLMGKNSAAIPFFEQTINLEPTNNLALVNLGWAKGKVAEGIKRGPDQVTAYRDSAIIIERGLLNTKPAEKDYDEINNARYFRQLADAYLRTNDRANHDKVNELGAARGVFPSKYQRSSYNVDGLRAQPWWTAKEADAELIVKKLEENWEIIRDEAELVFKKYKNKMDREAESLSVDNGKSDWRQFTFFERGQKNKKSCEIAPKTCKIIERYGGSRVTGCKRGQTKFSVMVPGTEVWPHVGPSNTRLRLHLGLIVPEDKENVRITCGGISRHWEAGKAFIFDDSFEHEVSHQASTFRMILIMDVWHPGVTARQRQTLSPI